MNVRSSKNCCIIGLGEAGRIYGLALKAAGWNVTGFDPYIDSDIDGITQFSSLDAAVQDAKVVIVLTGAAAAGQVFDSLLPHLKDEAVVMDMTSALPDEKQRASLRFSSAKYMDVAILGAVITYKERTPLIASGSGVEAVEQLAHDLGAPFSFVGDEPGKAMSHKMLRSVFMKGFASVVVEAMAASDLLSLQSFMREQISHLLGAEFDPVIDRFVSGTLKHASRRADEMEAVTQFLSSIGAPSEMSEASAQAMRRVAASTKGSEISGKDGAAE